jgi:hypothetical protein
LLDHCATVFMVRRYANDLGGQAIGESNVLAGAYRSLSYHFFDGEEYPAMRFRLMEDIGNGEYVVTADIEIAETLRGPSFNDYVEARMARALKDSVVSWKWADYPDSDVVADAVFAGSDRRQRPLSWLPEIAPRNAFTR